MRSYLLSALLLFAAPLRAAYPEALGPFGGSAAVVAVDTHRSGAVLAATNNALLFRSTNGGDSWQRVPFPAELRARLHAFVIVPRTGGYLVALSDETHTFSGLFQSADAGRTWNRVAALGPKDVWSVAVYPLNSRVIAAGTAEGVFLTRDGGERWERISPESNQALKPVVSLAFDIVDSRILYAGTPHLPWKTMNAGKTWEFAGAGMTDDSDVFSLLVDETRPLSVFATACSGLYYSANRAANWRRVMQAGGASSRTYQITQDATTPNVLFAVTASGLVRSMDRGATWRQLSNQAMRWIAFDPARQGRIYAATDQAGLFRSDDYGDSLTPINEGFCNRRILSFAASGDTLYVSSIAGSSSTDVLRRTALGGWETVAIPSESPDSQVLKIVSQTAGRLYALTPRHVLTSSGDGRVWTVAGAPSTTSRLTALAVVAANGERIVAGTEGEGIFFSDDAGETWSPARLPRAKAAIRSLVALGSQAIAAITNSGVFVSSGGSEFRAVTLPDAGAVVTEMLATESGLLAATSRGLVRSDTGGTNWRGVGGLLGGDTVSAICKHPTRRNVLFASRYGSIYASQDDGQTWTPLMAANLQSIEHLAVIETKPDEVFAVTRNQGIYVVSLAPKFAASAAR